MSEKAITTVDEERLHTLAAEINTIKRQTQKIMMEAAVEIGRRLVEAKGAVGHGSWGAWLEHNVDYSERTAQNLIRIFQEYGEGQTRLFGESNPQAFADLTYTQAVALLGIKNPDERAEFVETHDVANMTSRELADAIKERDEARAALSEAKEQLECSKADVALEQQLNKDLEKEKKELEDHIKALKDELENQVKPAEVPGQDEEIERYEKNIKAAEEKLEALETKLKAAEKERDAAGKERDKALKENIDLEKQLGEKQETLEALQDKIAELSSTPADGGKAAFAAYFNLSKNAFNGMLEAVGKIEEGQDKYRAAMVKMLEAMIESVKEAEE